MKPRPLARGALEDAIDDLAGLDKLHERATECVRLEHEKIERELNAIPKHERRNYAVVSGRKTGRLILVPRQRAYDGNLTPEEREYLCTPLFAITKGGAPLANPLQHT